MHIIKLILTTVIISVISLSVAQGQNNQNEFISVFKKKEGRTEHGGYGAISFGYGSIDGKAALQTSIRGAWVIDHNIALGFAGYGFINNLEKTNDINEYYLGGGYGGFYFEPIILPNSPIHVSFPILIGGGGISTIPSNYMEFDPGFDFLYQYDVFFVFEPGVDLEINMVKFFRIGLGASYRFTNGVLLTYPVSNNTVPKNVLDGFNFYMNLKFGKF